MVKLHRDVALMLYDNDNKVFEADWAADEYVWTFHGGKPIVITKEVDECFYNNLEWLMQQEYEFSNNLSYKDKNQLIWFSDQFCNLDNPNEVYRVNRAVIKRVKNSFVISCVNPYIKEFGGKMPDTSYVFFSPAGNGLYSQNKETGLTLQDDIVNMCRDTLDHKPMKLKKTP